MQGNIFYITVEEPVLVKSLQSASTSCISFLSMLVSSLNENICITIVTARWSSQGTSCFWKRSEAWYLGWISDPL